MLEKYNPQVLALATNYKDSQNKPNLLKANMDFVKLLVNAAKSVTIQSLLHLPRPLKYVLPLAVSYMTTTLPTPWLEFLIPRIWPTRAAQSENKTD